MEENTKVTLFLIVILVPCLTALCADRKSCCRGTFEHDLCKSDDGTDCRCDSQCMMGGDCCSDYREFCLNGPAVPCMYTPWETWSACSTRSYCDIGYRTRKRSILQTGNENSPHQCNYSDLTETIKCGDLFCHKFHINKIENMIEYKNKQFHFTNAVYQFTKTRTGDCNEFEPMSTTVCILCSDEDRCGNKVIKQNDTIDISYNSCFGTWTKITESVYKRTCQYMLPYRRHFAFIDSKTKK